MRSYAAQARPSSFYLGVSGPRGLKEILQCQWGIMTTVRKLILCIPSVASRLMFTNFKNCKYELWGQRCSFCFWERYTRHAKVCYDPVVLSSPSLQGLQSTFNRPFVESDTDRIRTAREQTVNVRKWVRDKMGGGFAESGAARTQSTE